MLKVGGLIPGIAIYFLNRQSLGYNDFTPSEFDHQESHNLDFQQKGGSQSIDEWFIHLRRFEALSSGSFVREALYEESFTEIAQRRLPNDQDCPANKIAQQTKFPSENKIA